MKMALSRALVCILILSCTTRAQETGKSRDTGDTYKFHMELKKLGQEGAASSGCGSLTFKDGRLPKLSGKEGTEDAIKYDTLKHSKFEDIDDECARKQLVKNKVLDSAQDYDKLDDKQKKLAKKIAIMDQAGELIDEELKKDSDALNKKKLRGAKRKLTNELRAARSKCDPSGTLKCGS